MQNQYGRRLVIIPHRWYILTTPSSLFHKGTRKNYRYMNLFKLEEWYPKNLYILLYRNFT
jgi:hypothetical protein